MDAKKKDILRMAGMDKQVDAVECGMCPTCGHPVCKEEFRNVISLKEYGISEMCQKCQDSVFGKD